MADTIAVMNEGRIEQMGSGEDLYERPRTEFVANFLGISNLLDGVVSARGGEMASFHTEEGVRVLVSEDAGGRTGTAALRIGVRPRRSRSRSRAGEANGSMNLVRGHVTVASYLGVSIHYVVTTPAGGRSP